MAQSVKLAEEIKCIQKSLERYFCNQNPLLKLSFISSFIEQFFFWLLQLMIMSYALHSAVTVSHDSKRMNRQIILCPFHLFKLLVCRMALNFSFPKGDNRNDTRKSFALSSSTQKVDCHHIF